jgi:hypothetical protein
LQGQELRKRKHAFRKPRATMQYFPDPDCPESRLDFLKVSHVATPRPAPPWFSIPAMVRMTVSTPAILGMLKGFTQPFNFVHVPLLFPSLYPPGKDPSTFSLVMPFSKHRDQWLNSSAWDTHSEDEYAICLLGTKAGAKTVEVKCYGNILGAYREHPDDGNPCNSLTRGLLRRRHIVAARHRYIGKESSRRWEQGDDMSMLDFVCAEYNDGQVVADKKARKRILRVGLKKISRETKTHRNTVRLIARGEPVKPKTFARVIEFVDGIDPARPNEIHRRAGRVL